MTQNQFKELYFEILEQLPSDIREFLLKRGKDIFIVLLIIGAIYVLTLSFIKYQENYRLNAAGQLGIAISENDIGKKEKMLKNIINSYSNTPSANFARLMLGGLMNDLSKKDDAKNYFTEAQKKLSPDSTLHFSARLGEAYSVIDSNQENAISILKEVADADNPYTSIAIISLAVLFENKGDLVNAKKYYEKYSTIFPNDPNSSLIKEKLKKIDELNGGNNTSG